MDNDLFKNILQFSLIMLAVMLIAYGAFYDYMFYGVDSSNIRFIILALFIVQSLPGILPIYINFAYTIMLVRLKANGILSLKSHKTVEGSRVETICFDKTGTLTYNEVALQKVIMVEPEGSFKACSPEESFRNT